MTLTEFSNEFDVLFNNITSGQSPGLDEYEKSVFLTKAQNELVKNYFNPRGNKYQEGFDGSQKRQVDFSNLMSNFSVKSSSPPEFTDSYNSVEITIPNEINVFVVLNEIVKVTYKVNSESKTKILQVIPIKYDEYLRLNSKPYKQPLKNQAWRLLVDSDTIGKKAAIIIGHNNTFSEYKLRYLRRPNPIIIEDLGEDLSIQGVHESSECELDEEIHPEILQRAVELAKAAYQGDLNSNVELGKRSE